MADCKAVDEGLKLVNPLKLNQGETILSQTLSQACPEVVKSKIGASQFHDNIVSAASAITDVNIQKRIIGLAVKLVKQQDQAFSRLEKIYGAVEKLPFEKDSPEEKLKAILQRAGQQFKELDNDERVASQIALNIKTLANITKAFLLTGTNEPAELNLSLLKGLEAAVIARDEILKDTLPPSPSMSKAVA
jgi:hypothetical protein